MKGTRIGARVVGIPAAAVRSRTGPNRPTHFLPGLALCSAQGDTHLRTSQINLKVPRGNGILPGHYRARRAPRHHTPAALHEKGSMHSLGRIDPEVVPRCRCLERGVHHRQAILEHGHRIDHRINHGLGLDSCKYSEQGRRQSGFHGGNVLHQPTPVCKPGVKQVSANPPLQLHDIALGVPEIDHLYLLALACFKDD